MAVDTANKRYSMLGVGLDFGRLRMVPDVGGVETADRLHLLPLYAGIAAGEPAAGGGDVRRRMRPGGPIWRQWKLLYRQGE